MRESLKERLNSHSSSFEGLLSLIPARYYYDEESNTQWQKRGLSEAAKKAAAEKAKAAKFDPAVGSSALDEIRRRQKGAASEELTKETEASGGRDDADEGDDESEDDDLEGVVVYDDNGNPIGEVEETIEDILRAKRAVGEAGDKPETAESQEPARAPPLKAAATRSKTPTDENGSRQPEPAPSSPDAASAAAPALEKPKIKIDELRKKLADRIADMRRQRKAPGSGVDGAPVNREMLLAARKRKLEAKKAHKKQLLEEKKAAASSSENTPTPTPTPEPEAAAEDPDAAGDAELDVEDDIMFSKVAFTDGSTLSKDLSAIEGQRNNKKRNAIDQLKVLEKRKEKIAGLDAEKQRQIAENSKWSRAILQSEGAKVRDDEKLLRKTIKQKKNKKHASEKQWRERLDNVKKGISDREAKRNLNIQAHKEAKRLHLKGKKRKMHMKRAAASLGGHK